MVELTPLRTRIPPLDTLREFSTPSVLPNDSDPPVSKVREFTFDVSTFDNAVVISMFVLAVIAIVVTVLVLYSLAANGRRIEVEVSAVANEVPKPVAVVSIKAQGIIAFVLVPAPPPPEPLNTTPPAVHWIVDTPTPAAVPRLVPRNSTVAPLGPVAAF
jgi:hypothetical protein